MLNLQERLILQQLVANPGVYSVLCKVHAQQVEDFQQLMTEEALKPTPNTNKLIQFAAQALAWNSVDQTYRDEASK